jgi:2-haloacid dehalogenase
MNRREMLALAALAAASPARTQPPERPHYRAIVFDAFPILDPRPAFQVVRSTFPSRSAELFDAWRIRQFEYQWLRALAGRYIDFERATLDALVFAGRSVGIVSRRTRKSRYSRAISGCERGRMLPTACPRSRPAA